MKSRIRLAALALTALSLGACDFDFVFDDVAWENPYRGRQSEGSRLVHGWESGALSSPEGLIAGRFDTINWPDPLEARDPQGRIDGRVLEFNLVAGAPQQSWGMALGWVWLPPRGSLVPGQAVPIPSGDIHITGCSGDRPGNWIFERDTRDVVGTLRADPHDPDLIHLDFNAAFPGQLAFQGQLSARYPRASGGIRTW